MPFLLSCLTVSLFCSFIREGERERETWTQVYKQNYSNVVTTILPIVTLMMTTKAVRYAQGSKHISYKSSALSSKKRELLLAAFLAFLRLLLLSLFLSPFALLHQPMPFPLPVAVEAEVFTRSFGRQMGTPLPALPGEEARRSSPFPIVFPTAIFFTVRGEAGVQISSIRLPASFLC